MVQRIGSAAKPVKTEAVPAGAAQARPLFVAAAEVKAELSKLGFELPENTQFAKDKALYPASKEQGYGVKLDIGERHGARVRFASTTTSNGDRFHRITLTAEGGATFHPNSRLGSKLVPDERGALQLPEELSAPIALPKARQDTIVLATASRNGDVVQVVTRAPDGKLKAQALALSDGKLVKLSEAAAKKLWTASEFRLAPGPHTTTPTTPAPVIHATGPVWPVVERPRPAAPTRPAAPAAPATTGKRRRDPNEFWTVQADERLGGFGVYRGNKLSGIATMQTHFATRAQADEYIRQQDGERLLFVQGNRNNPVWR